MNVLNVVQCTVIWKFMKKILEPIHQDSIGFCTFGLYETREGIVSGNLDLSWGRKSNEPRTYLRDMMTVSDIIINKLIDLGIEYEWDGKGSGIITIKNIDKNYFRQLMNQYNEAEAAVELGKQDSDSENDETTGHDTDDENDDNDENSEHDDDTDDETTTAEDNAIFNRLVIPDTNPYGRLIPMRFSGLITEMLRNYLARQTD